MLDDIVDCICFCCFVIPIQGFASDCSRVKKKEKKMKRLINGTPEDGNQSGSPEVTGGVENEKVHKRKSGKCKTFAKHEAIEAEKCVDSSCDTGHSTSKRKKSAAINGHKIKLTKSSDVTSAAEHKVDKVVVVSGNGDSSCLQQSDADGNGSQGDKKRKRKNKDHKRVQQNSQDNVQCTDEHFSKKLRTHQEDESDKTVVSTGDVQPGAFENYRISQSLVEKLQCK